MSVPNTQNIIAVSTSFYSKKLLVIIYISLQKCFVYYVQDSICDSTEIFSTIIKLHLYLRLRKDDIVTGLQNNVKLV